MRSSKPNLQPAAAILLLVLIVLLFCGSAVFVGVPVPLGTSGGIPCYTAANAIGSSAALTANALLKGAGAGACPAPSSVTVDASGNVTIPGTITTGSTGGGAVLIDGTTSGTVTLNTPAAVTTGTWQFPGGNDTVLGLNAVHFAPMGGFGGILPVQKTVLTSNLANGVNTTVYTAPTSPSRRALVNSVYCFNTVATTYTTYVVISAVNYRLGNANSLGANNTAPTVNANYLMVLEPGDSLQVNANAAGSNCFVNVIEFAPTYPFYSVRNAALGAGANTLYTVPTGKSARVFDYLNGQLSPPTGSIKYFNLSGANRATSVNYVPSGGTPTANNQVGSVTVTSSGNYSIFSVPGLLSSGDSISFTTDANTATQFVYFTVLEYSN